MNMASSVNKQRQIPFKALVPFFAVSFGLAWGILALYIFLPGLMTGLFGGLTGMHPLFFLAVYSPAIAAFILVARYGGARGLGRFVSRALMWKCSRAWYLFLFAGVPAVFYAGALLKGTLFGEPFPFLSLSTLLAALFFAMIKGPVEEFGWRGLALPLLQRKFTPITASLVLGVIWGLWHTPAFLLSGTQQSAWAFTPFFIGCIALSVIATALFNASGGSILLSAFFHFQLMNPIWPDAQPYDSLIFVVVAALMIWFKRETMLTGKGAATEVIPDTKTSIQSTVDS